jgi:hypothetical protein
MGESLTENIPPVPPAPQYPSQPPEGSAHPAPQADMRPAYGQQPYSQQGQHTPYPAHQYVPAGQWGVAGPPGPKSSGYRVAAGIVGIVLGFWLLIPAIAGFQRTGGTVFMAFLVLVAALGNITAGIILLANQRGRRQGPPATSLSFAGLAILFAVLGLAFPYLGVPLFVSSLFLAAPILVVMGIGLAKEKQGL